ATKLHHGGFHFRHWPGKVVSKGKPRAHAFVPQNGIPARTPQPGLSLNISMRSQVSLLPSALSQVGLLPRTVSTPWLQGLSRSKRAAPHVYRALTTNPLIRSELHQSHMLNTVLHSKTSRTREISSSARVANARDAHTATRSTRRCERT